jgi:hypothetical protein
MDNLNKRTLLKPDELKMRKCLKSYLTARKYFDIEPDKSFEYFKQCIKILENLKNKNEKQEFTEIINETETECSKYITQTIQKTIDKPILNTKPQNNNSELFDIIETGNLEKLKSYKFGELDFKVYNEEGLTPLHYAIKFGDTSFIKQSFKLGANIDLTNQRGHTLLEYACLERDPNMINFLMLCGANMKKHLDFRGGNKYFNNGSQIDIVILEKMIMNIQSDNEIKYLNNIIKYIDNINDYIELEYSDPKNSTISISKIKLLEFIKKLDNYLDIMDKVSRDTYLSIIEEELKYNLDFKLGCPVNKTEIILYNLVPFISYEYELSLSWLISQEIKYLILKILKNREKINTKQLKMELMELLYNSYIKNNVIPENMIQILVIQWLNKIKV